MDARDKSVRKVPGVGPSLHKRLKGTGVTTVGELVDRLPTKPLEAWSKKWKVDEDTLERIAESAQMIIEGADPKLLTARIEARKAERIRKRKEEEERERLEEQREAEKKAMMDAAERKVREEHERKKEIEERRKKREEKNKRAKEKAKGSDTEGDSAEFGDKAVAIDAKAVEEAKAKKEAEEKAQAEADKKAEDERKQKEAEEEAARKQKEAEAKAEEEAELKRKIEEARKEAAERAAKEEAKRKKREEKRKKEEKEREKKRKQQAAQSAKLKKSAEEKPETAAKAESKKEEPATPAPSAAAEPEKVAGLSPAMFRKVVAVAAAVLIFFLFYSTRNDLEEAQARARGLRSERDALREKIDRAPEAAAVPQTSEHFGVVGVVVNHDSVWVPCRVALNQPGAPVFELQLPGSGAGFQALEPNSFAERSTFSKVVTVFLESLDGSPLPRPQSIELWFDDLRVALPIEEGMPDVGGDKWAWNVEELMLDLR